MRKQYWQAQLAIALLSSTGTVTSAWALEPLSTVSGIQPGASLVADQSGEQGSENRAGSLEEIIVTATRRSESVEKVPISIEALGESDLVQNGVKGIAELAAIVPGLQFDTNIYGEYSSFSSIAIRGFNTVVGASTVGIYLDDTPLQGRMSPLGNIGFIYPLVFDLDRVEVARGPQGTLFGASSESGTLRFITNQPSLTQFSGFSHAELGSTQNGAPSYELGAAEGGPIVQDQLGFRVSVWDRRDGGYVDRVDPITGNIVDRNSNSDEKLALRGALAFKVNENTVITSSLFYQSIDSNDSSAFYDAFSDPSTDHFENGRLLPNVTSEHVFLPSLKVESGLSFADLTFTASHTYRTYNESLDEGTLVCAVQPDGCGNPLGIAYPAVPSDVSPSITGQTLQGFNEEIRLTSNQSNAFFTWVGGIFNDHRTQVDWQTLSASPQNAGPLGNPIFYVYQTITDSQTALFAQGDLHFTNKFTATLGARVERAKSDQTNLNGAGFFNAGVPPVVVSPTLKETPVLPRFALSYQADRDNLFYTSVSKGLRIGGGNNGLPTICDATAPATYDADHLWSYEVGSKNTFLDGRVQLDSSVFHIRWSQIQSTVVLACGLSYTANLGVADSNGFDLALKALVTEQLRYELNVGYADAHYIDDAYSPSGAPLALRGEAVQALSLVNPPWDVSTAANYQIPLSRGDNIYLRAQYLYHSRTTRPLITQVPSSPSYAPLDVPDPPTHLANARVGYTRNRWDVALYVNNLFNSHPLLGAYQDTPTSNLVTHGTFRPRTVGLSANYQF